MKELIKSYIILQKEIGKIMPFNEELITPLLDAQWVLCENDKYVNFDRDDIGDMDEYSPYCISSYSNKSLELFMGERDDLTFIMAYDEDSGWDSAEVLIFSNKNKVK